MKKNTKFIIISIIAVVIFAAVWIFSPGEKAVNILSNGFFMTAAALLSVTAVQIIGMLEVFSGVAFIFRSSNSRFLRNNTVDPGNNMKKYEKKADAPESDEKKKKKIDPVFMISGLISLAISLLLAIPTFN